MPFDWIAWQDEANQFVKHPEYIKTTDAKTIRKLLTLHVRMDRFSDGHLAKMLLARKSLGLRFSGRQTGWPKAPSRAVYGSGIRRPFTALA